MQKRVSFSAVLSIGMTLLVQAATAQTGGATFGNVVRLGGTPSDVVLDESRSRLYLVNQASNRIDVYSWPEGTVVRTFPTGESPVAAAMSMDSRYLYVSNNTSSSLTIIDLSSGGVLQTVSLTAKPEGLEVGADGRVLITTEGTSSTDQVNSLLLFDRQQAQGSQVVPVAFSPPPATPTNLPSVTIGRPTTTFRGKLMRTPDGNFIIGLSTVNNNAQTVVFVYEVASASILRSRTVTGQSTVLSVAPDGSRFMAGYTLYDTATLNVVAQYNAANVPFPLSTTTTTTTGPGGQQQAASTSFNSTQNMGGSVFSPDGETLFSAFNVAPATTPATRPQASTLLITNPRNLFVQLGIKIPESIVAKLVIRSNGEDAWGLSESGLIHLPLAKLYDYPILMPETTAVFLTVDDCNRGLAKARLRVDNIGKGTLTFSVPDTTAALVAQATSGVAPSSVEFTLEPGRTNVTRYYGTNLYSGAVSNTGNALAVNLSSPNAINVPPTIRVFMNVRQSDQRGVVFPVPTGLTAAEGLFDIMVDDKRGKVYITNSGYNRIDVFDKATQRFVDPIEVGQLPHQMASVGDGKHLYVANTGGESITVVDLDAKKVVRTIVFPARPRSGTTSPVSPQAIAHGLSGLQIAMSDGTMWKVIGNEASPRATSSVMPTSITTTGNNGPLRMMASTDGRSVVAMAGNGTFYRYDALADAYVSSLRPYTTTNIQSYYGPLVAGRDGTYYAANGFIFGPSLSVIGGSDSPTATSSLPLASKRNVAALGIVDDDRFLRLTTPVKQQIASTVNGDARTTLELVDLRDNSVTLVGAVAENPIQSRFGNTRLNVAPRQIAVDSEGTAYILTLSGMTMVPLTPTGTSRPQLSTNILNANDGTRVIRPGSFVLISGNNLASTATAGQIPLPTVLGGSCVTFSNAQLPLLRTAGGEILAQVPEDVSPGSYVAVVRSLATGQRSDAVVINVQ